MNAAFDHPHPADSSHMPVPMMRGKPKKKQARLHIRLTKLTNESHQALVILGQVLLLGFFLYVVMLLHRLLSKMQQVGHGFRIPPLDGSLPVPRTHGGVDPLVSPATAIPTVEADGLSAILVEGCRKKYGTVQFKNSSFLDDMSDEGIPPLLLSFPGAGNTMLRSLLEHATGYFTGSIYLSDKELHCVFVGEKSCTRLNSVIKGHPSDFIIRGQMDLHNRISKNGDKRDKLRGTSKFMRRKCANGKIQHFSRAVFVIRDPFRSILSEFQRIATNSHVGSVSLNQSMAVNLKNVKRSPLRVMNLTDVWLKVAMEKAKDFGDSMQNIITPLLLSNYSSLPLGNKNPQYPDLDFSTHVVRFEDLVNMQTRYKATRTLNLSLTLNPNPNPNPNPTPLR